MLNVENLQIFSFLTVHLKELFSRKELVFYIFFCRYLVVFLPISATSFVFFRANSMGVSCAASIVTSTKTSFDDLDCIFKVTSVLCLNSGGSLKEYFSSLDQLMFRTFYGFFFVLKAIKYCIHPDKYTVTF